MSAEEELIEALARASFQMESKIHWDDLEVSAAYTKKRYLDWAALAVAFLRAAGWRPPTRLEVDVDQAREIFYAITERDPADGVGSDIRWRGAEFAQSAPAELQTRKAYADWSNFMCLEMHAVGRNGTWEHILTQEWAATVASNDPAQLRRKLIQLIALATLWVEAIDRRPSEPVD